MDIKKEKRSTIINQKKTVKKTKKKKEKFKSVKRIQNINNSLTKHISKRKTTSLSAKKNKKKVKKKKKAKLKKNESPEKKENIKNSLKLPLKNVSNSKNFKDLKLQRTIILQTIKQSKLISFNKIEISKKRYINLICYIIKNTFENKKKNNIVFSFSQLKNFLFIDLLLKKELEEKQKNIYAKNLSKKVFQKWKSIIINKKNKKKEIIKTYAKLKKTKKKTKKKNLIKSKAPKKKKKIKRKIKLTYRSFNKQDEEIPFSNRISINSQMQQKFDKLAKYLPKTDSESEESSKDFLTKNSDEDFHKNKIDLKDSCDTDTKEN